MDPGKLSQVTSRRLRTLASHISAGEGETIVQSPTSNHEEDYTRSKINTATISSERSKARFDSKEMAHHIDGGKELTEVRGATQVTSVSTRSF